MAEIDLDRLEELIRTWARCYPIPANGLGHQAILFRLKMGLEYKPQEEVEDDMAETWAKLLMKTIKDDLEHRVASPYNNGGDGS